MRLTVADIGEPGAGLDTVRAQLTRSDGFEIDSGILTLTEGNVLTGLSLM